MVLCRSFFSCFCSEAPFWFVLSLVAHMRLLVYIHSDKAQEHVPTVPRHADITLSLLHGDPARLGWRETPLSAVFTSLLVHGAVLGVGEELGLGLR